MISGLKCRQQWPCGLSSYARTQLFVMASWSPCGPVQRGPTSVEGMAQEMMPRPVERRPRDRNRSNSQVYSSSALVSSAACLTSATMSRRNWLRSGDGVASGTGAAGS